MSNSRCGDLYEGEWYQNKRHGKGTMYWKSANELYNGQWEFGFQHGHGKHIWMVDTSDDTQVIANTIVLSSIIRIA